MTDLINPSRRGLLFGLGAALAAPAIIRVARLMPISAFEPANAYSIPYAAWRESQQSKYLLIYPRLPELIRELWENNNKFLTNLGNDYHYFRIENVR